MSPIALLTKVAPILATLCIVQATDNFKSPLTPVLLAFETAIEHAVDTVEPPGLQFKMGGPLNSLLRRSVYEGHIKSFRETPSLFGKIRWLTLDKLDDFRAAVVDNVMENVQGHLRVDSREEAKTIVLRACKSLAREIRPALAKEDAMKDADLVRLVNLVTFCNFL